MHTSPRMKEFVLWLCERHGFDLAQAVPGDYFRLESPEGNANLTVSVVDGAQIAVGYTCWYANSLGIELEMKFLVTVYGWEPVSVQDYFSHSWDEYWTEAGREGIAVFDATGLLILPSMTEYWADRLLTWGWLEKGVLEEGELSMLANQPQPFPPITQRTPRKPPAAQTPITEALTQVSLF